MIRESRLKKSCMVAPAKERRNSSRRLTAVMATIVFVTVVPMLAPMMRGIAFRTVRASAATSPTTREVVVEELWIRAVAIMPTISPITGSVVLVIRASEKSFPKSLKAAPMSPMETRKR
jgi:hypothetical protein